MGSTPRAERAKVVIHTFLAQFRCVGPPGGQVCMEINNTPKLSMCWTARSSTDFGQSRLRDGGQLN